MPQVFIPPDTPCVVSGFDPDEDILIVALPAEAAEDLGHRLAFRHDRRRDFLELTVTHAASGSRFLVHLPGVRRLDPAAIAVVSLDEAEALPPPTRSERGAALTGSGTYPRALARGVAGPRKMSFVHRHNWYRAGPPAERFFDLSDPGSELDIRLDTENGGAVYAIRLTENARPILPDGGSAGKSSDIHRSIVLVQTSPRTPILTPGVLAQWFATRLGSDDFRAIAWIWLGNKGHYVDPETRRIHRFGSINEDPIFAIHGPLAGSVAIER